MYRPNKVSKEQELDRLRKQLHTLRLQELERDRVMWAQRTALLSKGRRVVVKL